MSALPFHRVKRTMNTIDTSQTCIAIQLDTDNHEDLVEYACFFASDIAEVSPLVDQIMQLINGLRPHDGSEVEIEVALREALLNAIIHGNREDPVKQVHLRVLCRTHGEISITVRDEGVGFDISSVPDPTAPENRMSTHGRGIYLMRALMDEVSFEEGGTVVFMRKAPNAVPYKPQ
jgi:serine/threonine-protein kinase RsbW